MTASAWLLVRTSPLRWWAAVAAPACLVLVSPGVTTATGTSMSVSAEAGFAILLWAPSATFAGYLATRRSCLSTQSDVLTLATTTSRLRRVISVLAAPLSWSFLGWLGFWGAVGVIAPFGTSAYWSMALNGLSLSTLAILLGTGLAVLRTPAWVAGIAAGTTYVGLAAWSYLPGTPASILFSTYTPRFFSAALPSTDYLLTQAAWASTALVLLVLGLSRVLTWPVVAGSLAVAGALTVAIASATPYVLPRSGTIALDCDGHRGVTVCLWADHQHTRPTVEAAVDLARRLVAGAPLPPLLVAQDQDPGPPKALAPADREQAVPMPASAHPRPRSIAASLVLASFGLPSGCPRPRTAEEFATSAALTISEVVSRRTHPDNGSPMSDAAITAWLGEARGRITGCTLLTPP